MKPNAVPQRSVDWTTDLADYVHSVSWSLDRQSLAAATASGTIALLEGATGRTKIIWPGHAGGTFRATFSPAGERLASVGQDGHVRFWEPGHEASLAAVAVGKNWVEHLAWAPDGSALAVAAGRQVLVLNPEGKIAHSLPPLPSTVSALTWRSDSRELAASAYGLVQRWDALSGEPREALRWKTSLISLSWSPDRRWLVAGTQEQSIQIWELPFRPGEELAMSGYPAKVKGLAWHYSSRYLVSDGGSEIMVWDCGGRGPAGTTPRILEGHAERVNAVAYQRAGHLLASGADDGGVLLWNAGKSSSPLTQMRMSGAVSCLDWSRDDQVLAVGCRTGIVAAASQISPA